MASDRSARRRAPLFPLGQTVATPAALRLLAWYEVTPTQLLDRHVTGDWGVLCNEDIEENELSLREGFRLFSNYPACDCAGENCDEHRVWLITEADRSVTTILLPDDY
jgi:hypothetical protein